MPRLRCGPYLAGAGSGSSLVIITILPDTGPALAERTWDEPGVALNAMARTGVPLTGSELGSPGGLETTPNMGRVSEGRETAQFACISVWGVC